MKRVLLALTIFLAACNSPQDSSTKVIVGAKLVVAPGREPVEYSVIVIDGAKIRDAGTQSATPVPKGAQMTQGLGHTVESLPGGTPIEKGQPADLVLKGPPDRIMRAGEWQQ
jgi:hypothetical protein